MAHKSRLVPLVAMAIFVSSLGVSGIAKASTFTAGTASSTSMMIKKAMRHHLDNFELNNASSSASTTHHFSRFSQEVRGTVSSINGSTLTIQSKDGTTYTVEAGIAKIIRGTASSTVATSSIEVTDIKVGDQVLIKGTISGTTVTAKKILDGDLPHNGRRGLKGKTK